MDVIIDGMAWLPKAEYSPADLVLLKRRLTLVPKKTSDFDTLEPLQLYQERDGLVGVPREYYFSHLRGRASREIVAVSDGFEMTKLKPISLLLHQIPIHERVINYFKQGNMGCCVQAETAAGKTIVALEIARTLSKSTLVVVHKESLAEQWEEKINRFLPGARVGRLQAERVDYKGRDITIGLVQSLCSKDFPYDVFDSFGLVIADECLDAGTLVAVRLGHKRLGEVEIGDEVATPSGYAIVTDKWVSTMEAFEYLFESGKRLIGSKSHLVSTIIGDWEQFKIKHSRREIKPIGDSDNVEIYRGKLDNVSENYIERFIGWYVGDGTWDGGYVKFSFRKSEKVAALTDLANFGKIPYSIRNNSRGDITVYFGRSAVPILKRYEMAFDKDCSRAFVPMDIYKSCSASFIGGLFDADGTFNKDRIELDTASSVLCYQISEMLSSLGIHNTVRHFDAKSSKWSGRNRLCIFGESIRRFDNIIGFRVASKNKKLKGYITNRKRSIRENVRDKIVSIKPLGERKLIDIALNDDENLFIANGCVVHNCHRMGAYEWSLAVPRFKARWRLGLSATARRKDGMENVFFWTLGPIIANFEGYAMEPVVYVRPTRFSLVQTPFFNPEKMPRVHLISALTESSYRNNMISAEIWKALIAGRKPIVISDRIKHLEELIDLLKYQMKRDGKRYSIGRFWRGDGKKTKEQLQEAKEMDIVFGTMKMIEEGEDLPDKDALFLVTPCSDPIQSAGRVLRRVEGKKQPIIVDFADVRVPMCKGLMWSRVKWYKTKGWEVRGLESWG